MGEVFASALAAVADVADGSTIAIAGFGGGHRAPGTLVAALGEQGASNLCLVTNGIGVHPREHLIDKGRVTKIIAAFAPRNRPPGATEEGVASGAIAFELVPQGTLVERCRAAGAGIPAFFTPAGADTMISSGKELRWFNGRPYILEQWLPVDYAFLHAYRADEWGNVQFRGGSQNFGPSFAKAARVAIVEAEEIVPFGAIAPGDIDLPGIFVARVVQKTDSFDIAGMIEARKGRKRPPDLPKTYGGKTALTRAQAAQAAAALLPEGSVVNLGVGIPTMISNYLAGRNIVLHAENGVLGYGEQVEGEDVDLDIYNAGGEFVSMNVGGAYFDSVTSFEMARGGHLTAVVLGAYQVDQAGNLANWTTGGFLEGGIGGAMDLVAGRKLLMIVMEHRDSQDRPKLVKQVAFDPTGRNCVDVVVTDLAVLRRINGRFVLEQIAPGFTVAEVLAQTEMDLAIADRVTTMLSPIP
ncbi:MAG TPA: 3-oxoacid CoA-transferase subunit A [Chloroflexota bacterium]|nr:3-oxoacid CoA-transferase subunit A [Chloroflexota bacterium]